MGSIINIDKMYKAHQVLDNIRAFHIHAIRRKQLLSRMKQSNTMDFLGNATHSGGNGTNASGHLVNTSNSLYYQMYCDQLLEDELAKFDSNNNHTANSQNQPTSGSMIKDRSLSRSGTAASGKHKDECDRLYQIELETYKPIQPLSRSHGISLIPLDHHLIDYHCLQAMHHGMTTIHYEEDTGRSAPVYLQLAESNSFLAWGKPHWSTSLRQSGNNPQDYQLSVDIEDVVLTGVTMKYETKEAAVFSLDEGFIDLMHLKDIVVGQTTADLTNIARRHGLPDLTFLESNTCSIKLLFGINLNDNRVTEFIAPRCIADIWVEGLRSVFFLIQQQKKLVDQRILWLKEKYLQLYYEDIMCVGPVPAEAIRVFGGRKWTIDAMGSSHQSLTIDNNAKQLANSAKQRKKKSTVSLAVNRDPSTRSQLSVNSEPDSTLHNIRFSPQHSTKSPKTSIRSQQAVSIVYEHDSPSNLSSAKSSPSPSDAYKSLMAFDGAAIHTSLLTCQYREKFCKKSFAFDSSLLIHQSSPNKQAMTFGGANRSLTNSCCNSQPQTPKHTSVNTKMAVTHSSNMNFIEFIELFRSFLICIRRDIKNIYEMIASKSKFCLSIQSRLIFRFSPGDIQTFKEAESNFQDEESSKQSEMNNNNNQDQPISTAKQDFYQGTYDKNETTKEQFPESSYWKEHKYLGLLTRNMDLEQSEDEYRKSQIYDAIASASIVTNGAGIDSLKTSVLTDVDFLSFIKTYQCEEMSLDQVKSLIQMHEPDPVLRKRNSLSFEGFARYLMDKNNFAYTPELNEINEEDMDYPLSHYYVASSHNTYLTGHQLKGESSVELYSQVRLLPATRHDHQPFCLIYRFY